MRPGQWETQAVVAPVRYLMDCRIGLLCRWGSFWLGWHWSPYNRRLCVNLVPCCTIWIALPDGRVP